jgi:hypothetical protein
VDDLSAEDCWRRRNIHTAVTRRLHLYAPSPRHGKRRRPRPTGEVHDEIYSHTQICLPARFRIGSHRDCVRLRGRSGCSCRRWRLLLAGNLLVSRVVYDNNPNNVQVGAPLPPNCVGAACVPATSDGTYPFVWNNDLVDASFGITAKILLDQLTLSGQFINSLEVPNSLQKGVPPTKDQMVTSRPNPRWRSICRPMVSS